MGNCDLCGTIISPGAKKYPASQFRELVKAGLRPPDSLWKMALLESGGMASKTEWEAGWIQMVQQDTSDWALCNSCVAEAESYKS